MALPGFPSSPWQSMGGDAQLTGAGRSSVLCRTPNSADSSEALYRAVGRKAIQNPAATKASSLKILEP